MKAINIFIYQVTQEREPSEKICTNFCWIGQHPQINTDQVKSAFHQVSELVQINKA